MSPSHTHFCSLNSLLPILWRGVFEPSPLPSKLRYFSISDPLSRWLFLQLYTENKDQHIGKLQLLHQNKTKIKTDGCCHPPFFLLPQRECHLIYLMSLLPCASCILVFLLFQEHQQVFLSAQFFTILSTFLWQFKYVQPSPILKINKGKTPPNHNSIWNYCQSPSFFTHNLFRIPTTSPSVLFLIFHNNSDSLIWLMPHQYMKMGIIIYTII